MSCFADRHRLANRGHCDTRLRRTGVPAGLCDDCDPQWLTRSAAVSGWMGRREVDVKVVRNEYGQWLLNARECDQVAGCTDIDLNFSPSTNLLPIRRLNLQVGEAAQVRAASPLITFLPPTGVYLFSRAIPEIVDCSSFSDISRTYIKSAAA